MTPKRSLGLAVGMLLLASPASAYAADVGGVDLSATVSVITGAGSLLLAGLLLVVVVQLRRVAAGSAIADHVSYVVGASLCLVAAVVLKWLDRFAPSFSVAFVRAGADVLTMVCVLLFAIYFSRVKNSLKSFLSHLHSDEALAAANGADVEGDAGA